MTTPLAFTVHGTPRPQPRPRFVPGRARPVSTADPKAKLWRAAVAKAVKAALANRGDAVPLFAGPVVVMMVFTFTTSVEDERHRVGMPHTQKPDGDNLAKAVADVMEATGVFKNDASVAEWDVRKVWGARAGVAVIVRTLEGVTRAPDATAWASTAPAWLR